MTWKATNYSRQLQEAVNDLHTSPVVITGLHADVVELSLGDLQTCARMSDGTVACWGGNGDGQLGVGTVTDPIATPLEVSKLGHDVVKVTAGGNHTCALKQNGTLWCWGSNLYGQLGAGTFDGDSCRDSDAGTCERAPIEVTALGAEVADVAAGGAHTCARKVDGTLWCWGRNLLGQLGTGAVDGVPCPDGSGSFCNPTPQRVSVSCR